MHRMIGPLASWDVDIRQRTPHQRQRDTCDAHLHQHITGRGLQHLGTCWIRPCSKSCCCMAGKERCYQRLLHHVIIHDRLCSRVLLPASAQWSESSAPRRPLQIDDRGNAWLGCPADRHSGIEPDYCKAACKVWWQGAPQYERLGDPSQGVRPTGRSMQGTQSSRQLTAK